MKKTILIFLLGLGIFSGVKKIQAEQSFPFKLSSRSSLSEVQRFKGEGQTHLVYELYLENFHPKPLQIEVLQIQLLNKGATVFTKEIKGEELAKSYTGIAENYLKPQDPILAPGSAGILFIFIDLPQKVGAFETIQNQLIVEESGNLASRQTLQAGNISVSAKSPIVVSPPLKGTNWWTFNGPGNQTVHRRIVIPMGSEIWSPERFASDWIKLDAQGKNYTGPADQNASYHAYGAEVLAIAEGKIIAVKDGIPENVPNSGKMAVTINLETIGGNYIMQDLGGERYAFYAHLQPGKTQVKVGDVVKKGQILGLLGNSGNSTEPHLHFHVIDRPNPLQAQGQPYLFDRFTRVWADIPLDKDDNVLSFKIKGRKEVTNEAYMNLEDVDF